MRLANNDVLTSEEVQLLANCSEPVYVPEISTVAEALILRGLVRPFCAVCQHNNRRCFLLVASEKGRLYIQEWIERHGNDSSDSVGNGDPMVQIPSASWVTPLSALASDTDDPPATELRGGALDTPPSP